MSKEQVGQFDEDDMYVVADEDGDMFICKYCEEQLIDCDCESVDEDDEDAEYVKKTTSDETEEIDIIRMSDYDIDDFIEDEEEK